MSEWNVERFSMLPFLSLTYCKLAFALNKSTEIVFVKVTRDSGGPIHWARLSPSLCLTSLLLLALLNTPFLELPLGH